MEAGRCRDHFPKKMYFPKRSFPRMYIPVLNSILQVTIQGQFMMRKPRADKCFKQNACSFDSLQ